MHRSHLLRQLLGIFTCAAIAASLFLTPHAARAAEAPKDDPYIFGAQLVLISPKQLDVKNAYWVDMLPKAYTYSAGSIIDAINAARKTRGVTSEVDVANYPLNVGSEMQRGKQWEYNINFQWMTPDDIAVALNHFPLTGKLAGLEKRYRPLQSATFGSVTADDGLSASVDLLGTQLTFTYDDSFSAFKAKVAQVLAARFGDRAKFDLSTSGVFMAAGEYQNGSSFSITVYLDGAEKQAVSDEAP